MKRIILIVTLLLALIITAGTASAGIILGPGWPFLPPIITPPVVSAPVPYPYPYGYSGYPYGYYSYPYGYYPFRPWGPRYWGYGWGYGRGYYGYRGHGYWGGGHGYYGHGAP
ncbi:MAG: hypothetical protein ACXU93_12975, partial [Thermodesulfobacteriota bacterium]